MIKSFCRKKQNPPIWIIRVVLRLEEEDEQSQDDEDEPSDQVLVVLQEVPLDPLYAPPAQGDHEEEDAQGHHDVYDGDEGQAGDPLRPDDEEVASHGDAWGEKECKKKRYWEESTGCFLQKMLKESITPRWRL